MKNTYRDALKHVPKTVASSIFIELFQVATTVIFASIIGRFSDAVFDNDLKYVTENLWYLLACVFTSVIVIPMLSYLGDTICIKDSIRFDIHMFSQFLNLPYEIGSEIPIGEVKTRLESDVVAFRNSIILIIVKAVITPITLIGIAVLMGKINILYATITLFISLIILIVPHFTKKLNAKYDGETREYIAKESSISYDLIIFAPFIKLYGLGKKLLSEYQDSFIEYRNKTQRKSIWLKTVCDNFSLLLSILSNILVLIVGAYFLSKHLISAGDILMMNGFYAVLLSTMENIGFIVSRTTILKKVENRVAIFYTEDDYAHCPISDRLLPLKAYQVSYSVEDKCILNPISFQLNPGQKVAIIGENGTGKSTLLNIITGLYHKYDGSIVCGNRELKSYFLEALSEQYSFVSQSPFVFSGTVLENIMFGCNTPNMEKADTVLKLLGLFDLRDHVVNTKANNLSDGELQRISLARALLRDKPVLIMDEPSNNLDSDCVAWIKDFIKTGEKSILYVTHDKEFISLSDTIIILDRKCSNC